MTACLFCPYTYDDTQPGLYIDHLETHVRQWRATATARQARFTELERQLRETGDALVATGCELLAVVP